VAVGSWTSRGRRILYEPGSTDAEIGAHDDLQSKRGGRHLDLLVDDVPTTQGIDWGPD
jgi:hypothetical protein